MLNRTIPSLSDSNSGTSRCPHVPRDEAPALDRMTTRPWVAACQVYSEYGSEEDVKEDKWKMDLIEQSSFTLYIYLLVVSIFNFRGNWSSRCQVINYAAGIGSNRYEKQWRRISLKLNYFIPTLYASTSRLGYSMHLFSLGYAGVGYDIGGERKKS
jgi:hypothetical protein